MKKLLLLVFGILISIQSLLAQSEDFGRKKVLIFDSSTSIQLNQAAVDYLSVLVKFLQANPELKIKITGHTDQKGIFKDLLERSIARAKAVAEYLISNGIAKSRISERGDGARMPIYDNSTEDGSRRNNRVEISIIQPESESREESSHSELHESVGHHVFTNHLAVFCGATTNFEAKETNLTIGLDYELSPQFLRGKDMRGGIGIFGEMINAEYKEYLVGIAFFFHPAGGLKIFFSPAVAIAEEPVEELYIPEEIKYKNQLLSSGSEDIEYKTNFLLRFGLGYDFHLGIFSITPTLAFDLIENHVSLVYGIGFGIGF